MKRPALIFCFATLCSSFAIADSGLEKKASWSWPSSKLLSNQFDQYVQSARAADQEIDTEESIARDWSDAVANVQGPQLLDDWVRVVSSVAPELHDFLIHIIQPNSNEKGDQVVSQFTTISQSLSPYLEKNGRLIVGRYLAQNQLYDEAIEVLEPLQVDEVVDPSSLLFYRAVSYHHVLRRDECLSSIDTLLQRESELVSRYAVLSKLMRADIQPLKEDSLDEIARLMSDVQRRLELERSGKVVRAQEDTIIEKLDKKIDEIEQQLQEMQQQQAQAQGQAGDSNPNGKPMQDSQIAGGSGPGNVTPKDIGQKSGWGDLPPAQRQEALQNMTQDLPSHYREIIEAYFKRLATESR